MAATGVPYSVATHAVDQAAASAQEREATRMVTTVTEAPSHYGRFNDEGVLKGWA